MPEENGNGFNGIACGNNFLYTSDGTLIHKYNKNTGEILASLDLGLEAKYQGGLDIDDCGKLYVGSPDSVLVFNSDFEQLEGYEVSDTVYDLIIDGGKLYVTGKNFVTQIDIPSGGVEENNVNYRNKRRLRIAVAQQALWLAILFCPECDYEAVSWSPGGETTATIDSLCAGWYYATATWLCEDGSTVTRTDSVEILSSEGFDVTVVENGYDPCGGCNGSAVLLPEGGTEPYTFELVGVEENSTGEFFGLCAGLYNFVVTDAEGCASAGSVEIVEEEEPGVGPKADFVYSPTTIYEDNTEVTFTNTSTGATSYEWNFGDGFTYFDR